MSYWLNNIDLVCHNSDDLPGTLFDTVIIGCGISGASTAYHLAQCSPNSKIAILERGDVSSGATGCNGGFICPGTSEKFSASVDRYGLEATQAMYDYTVRCTELVQAFVKDHSVDCELRFHGCVELASSSEELAGLRKSYEQLISFGQHVEWWDETVCRERTKSESFLGGLYNPRAGMLWAAKLVYALVAEAVKLGVQVFTHNPVTQVVEDGEGQLAVHTSRGIVRAKRVVYAANAWVRELLPELQEVIVPVRNQLIMTKPMPRMWDFSLVSNYGYEYYQQRPDGRILLGGMRHLAPNKEVNCADTVTLNPEVSASLRSFLPRRFPDLRTPSSASEASGDPADTSITAAATQSSTEDDGQTAPVTAQASIDTEAEWLGIMAFTPDRNPLVGRLTYRREQYILAGYTGHGMPVAFLAGRNIAELICAVESTVPLPPAYAPGRFGL